MRLSNIIKEVGRNYYNWLEFYRKYDDEMCKEYLVAVKWFVGPGKPEPLMLFITEHKDFIEDLQNWILPNSVKCYRGFKDLTEKVTVPWRVSTDHRLETRKIVNMDMGETTMFLPTQKMWALQHWTYDLQQAKEFGARNNNIHDGIVLKANIKKEQILFSYISMKPMVGKYAGVRHGEEVVPLSEYKKEKEIIVYHNKSITAKAIWKWIAPAKQ